MDTSELLETINNGDASAPDLLDALDPKLKAKFLRAMGSLAKIINEVKEVYPDAHYYVDDDNVQLLLGKSHSDDGGSAYPELMACDDNGKLHGRISGGGW